MPRTRSSFEGGVRKRRIYVTSLGELRGELRELQASHWKAKGDKLVPHCG